MFHLLLDLKMKEALEKLLTSRIIEQDLKNDPLSFVHRYTEAKDQEIAGLFASQLAYGRVSLFLPILQAFFDIVDQDGGPRKWIEEFNVQKHSTLATIKYRWNNPIDFILMAHTLQNIFQTYDSIGSLFGNSEQELQDSNQNSQFDHAQTLDMVISILRTSAVQSAENAGLSCSRFQDLPRGFRTWLSTPNEKSACKRWNLYLRWMVRTEHPDIGIWKISPSRLRIPLDKHVHDLSLMLGLTSRKNSDNQTVTEITQKLKTLHVEDPIRYDFSLAHLGISGGCQKTYIKDICSTCVLQNDCIHGQSHM